MSLAISVLCAVLFVGVPGVAAVCWTRRVLPERAANPVACLAIAYGGVGLAVIALWLGTMLLGLSSTTAIGCVLGVSALAALTAGNKGGLDTAESSEPTRAVIGLALVSTIVVGIPFLPHGLERADGIHRVAMTDWEHHLVIATGIAGSDFFPPPHPYLHADPDPSYYFGYDLLGAAVQVASGHRGDLFAILLTLTLLTAAATPVVVYVFARDLARPPVALVAAAGSSLLVGFDLLVMLVQALRNVVVGWPLPGGFDTVRALVPSMHIDYWIHNLDRQFSAPLVATMWAPHQTAATLIALLVIYLLSPAREAREHGPRSWLLPALLIASLPALSAYVAFGLALGIGFALAGDAWTARTAPWSTDTFRRWAAPGALAVGFALPVLPTLSSGSSSGLVLGTSLAGDWTNGALFTSVFGSDWWTELLDTPAVYLVDFGIIGLLATLELVRRRGRPQAKTETQAILVAVSILVFVVIVRPPYGIGNNLYARALLLPWFLLAPFAAAAALRAPRRRWVAAAVLMCALGTGYVLSGYLLEGAIFWGSSPDKIAALQWINRNTEPDDLVAIEPEHYGVEVGIWLRRPLSFANRRLAMLFGASDAEVKRAEEQVAAGYGATDAALAARAFDELEAVAILVPSPPMRPWALPPCFERAFANAEWMVVRRTGASCEPP